MGTVALVMTLLVRLYDGGALADADKAAAIATARNILLAASIPTSWPDCAPPKPRPKPGAIPAPRVTAPQGPGASRSQSSSAIGELEEDASSPQARADHSAFVCARPMGEDEVAVRIVRTPASTSSRRMLTLGYSLVDTTRHGGALATIYLDRVESVAADSGTAPAVVLGRAIAHEIGHLLLGTAAHAEHGLMRALWSRAMLARNDPADWRFTDADTQAMHRALGRRVPVTRAAEHIARGTR